MQTMRTLGWAAAALLAWTAVTADAQTAADNPSFTIAETTTTIEKVENVD